MTKGSRMYLVTQSMGARYKFCGNFVSLLACFLLDLTPHPGANKKKQLESIEGCHEQHPSSLHLLQGSAMAKQLGAEAYLECSAFTSEKSIHSVFRTAAMACINKLQPLPKPSPTRRLSKRLLHLPSKSDLLTSTFKKEKAKSCSVM